MSDDAFRVLEELRMEEQLCDVVIQTGDTQFNAHKVVLCSCSLYFRTLFTGAWSSPQRVHVVPWVAPEAMRLVLAFAYTHAVSVTRGNVAALLAAADQLLVPGLLEACCCFLERHLQPHTCISSWMLVDLHHAPRIRLRLFRYILHHFEQAVAASPDDFLRLSARQLAAILEEDRLNVQREDAVLLTAVRWLDHQPDLRLDHAPQLLDKVRFGLINTKNFDSLMTDAVTLSPAVSTAVAQYLDRRFGPESVPLNLPDKPRLPPAILLATGGRNNRSVVTHLEAYDVRSDRWVTVSARKIRRSGHGAAALHGFVYLIGGNFQGVDYRTVEKFDIRDGTWHAVAAMNCRRSGVSAAAADGCIYAIGGQSDRVFYDTVERYRPETDRWVHVAPMNARRASAGAATLQGKVYVCGGFNGYFALHTAEVYDPSANQWSLIAHMDVYRLGLGVAAYKGHIYAMGGTTGRNRMLDVEVYDPHSNTWSAAPSMSRQRSFFGVAAVDDQLVVVGGQQGAACTMSVERYDHEIRQWKQVSSTKKPLSDLSCCVLTGLYDVTEKLFSRSS